MRRTGLVLGAIGVAVLLPVLALLATAWTQGWTLADVTTGSMRPGIEPGSLIVLAPVDPAAVEAGTVIGFRDRRRPGAVVTHRVVEVLEQPSGRYFRTQGDANPRADGALVAARDVVGAVRWRVVGLGTIASAATDGRVQLGLVGVPAALLVVSELAGRRRPPPPVADRCIVLRPRRPQPAGAARR